VELILKECLDTRTPLRRERQLRLLETMALLETLACQAAAGGETHLA
jgi:hypothetical protein